MPTDQPKEIGQRLPEGMTAQKLRDLASWFDTYDAMGVTFIHLTGGGKTADEIAELNAIVRGKGVQVELRRWADEIETALSLPAPAPHSFTGQLTTAVDPYEAARRAREASSAK